MRVVFSSSRYGKFKSVGAHRLSLQVKLENILVDTKLLTARFADFDQTSVPAVGLYPQGGTLGYVSP